jgi:hypothetical protein
MPVEVTVRPDPAPVYPRPWTRCRRGSQTISPPQYGLPRWPRDLTFGSEGCYIESPEGALPVKELDGSSGSIRETQLRVVCMEYAR